ncbi:23S rRNA (pseudouridine(1915)-N(3))-methyltransferase RlmH [Salibacterium halotolerans]|uniref:Ribosomal RNA large subunit methyltransferase H n=1 Tax=Salibacterium halotolerans TaxID=1884432 RepID=A0A1I5U2Z1_9BACI|nr:23S rRNA (pseudouridine(1915)-N(3))-methyltransferase RlmH [Salibacterium halotolerans]SFP89541.1 23S rRNA (pseudouridine1915-N3)-methyltransferase [Salibacterium halotolerans]
MQIQIVSVGKIKEKYLKQGIEEFEKRLGPYCKLTMDEVNDEQAPEQMSEKEKQQVTEKEGERILHKIKPGRNVIVLDIGGHEWSSEKLAEKMEKWSLHGHSQLTFVIGGSNGVSEAVLQRADHKLSFSNMTFPHQLMKLLLLEQIYRAFKIQKGEPYHK